MESSTVIAFRALVMLSCLIVVPLAAIFGSQFPEVVKSVLLDRILPGNKPASAADNARTEAPPFQGAQLQGTQLQGTQHTAWQAGDAASGPAAPAAHAATEPQGMPSVVPGWPNSGSGVEQAAAWNPTGDVRPAAAHATVETSAFGPRSGTAPGNAAGPGGAMSAGAAPGQASPQVLSQPDRFTWMERRLREYGATYYLLETWGNESDRYRFHCKMAVAHNPGRTRQFEATDSDPLRAMGRVVEQVEAWRAGRTQ